MALSKKTKNILAVMFIFIGISLIVSVGYKTNYLTQNQIVLIIVGGVTLSAVVLAFGTIKKWLEQRIELRQSMTPKRSAELLIQYYAETEGKHVTVRLKRSFFPKVKSGRDKVARMIVTVNGEELPIAIKVPLDRGEEAILGGDISFDEDLDLYTHNKREDAMFSPESNLPTVFEDISGIDPDLAREVLARKIIHHVDQESEEQPKKEDKDND